MVKLVEREEAKVQGWIEIAQADAERYDELLRQVRDTLKAEKVYDGRGAAARRGPLARKIADSSKDR
jgi:cell division FtsZ-interacting protein ZapD